MLPLNQQLSLNLKKKKKIVCNLLLFHAQEKSDGAAQLCALRFTVTVSEFVRASV